jgi:hypothetical protein
MSSLRVPGRLLRAGIAVAAITPWFSLSVLSSRSACAMKTTTREAVARYVRDFVLHGVSPGTSFRITPRPLDPSHVARDVDADVADLPFPFPRTWLVLIDDHPKANWGHPCRWVFVSDDLRHHTTPQLKEFPPTVWEHRGAGPEIRLVHTTPSP